MSSTRDEQSRVMLRQALLAMTGTVPSDAEIEGLLRLHAMPTKDLKTAVEIAHAAEIKSVPRALAWAKALMPPSRTVRECAAAFMETKGKEGVSGITLQAYKSRLDKFVASHGDQYPNDLEGSVIISYLGQWSQPQTVRSQRGTLHTFYNWMMQMGYARGNLVANAVKPIARITPNGIIFSPAEVRTLLRETMFTDEIGYWVLSLYGGLRCADAKWLQAQLSPWSQIDLKRSEIRLGYRVVRILPVLRHWLEWIRQQGSPFYPLNFWEKSRRTQLMILGTRYLRLIGEGRIAADTPRPRSTGVPRRTFMAYRFALAETDLARLVDETGQTERYLRVRYSNWAPLNAAREFFSLTPKLVGRTIKDNVHFQLKSKRMVSIEESMAQVITSSRPSQGSLVRAGGRPDSVVAFEMQMVDFFVDAADILGVPKSVASVYGIIFASPQPLSFSEISARVDFSNGSVSQGLKALREIGAIKATTTDKDKLERFIPDLELRNLVARFLEHRLEKHLDAGSTRLVDLKQAIPTGDKATVSELNRRLKSLSDWHMRARQLLPVAKVFLKLTPG